MRNKKHTPEEKAARRERPLGRSPARRLVAVSMIFYFLAFLLLALKDFSWEAIGMAFAVPAIFYIGVMGLPKLFHADKLLLSLVNFLCALGVLVLFRLDKDKGFSQAVNYLVGVGAMLVCIMLVRYIKSWKWFILIMAAGSAVMLLLPYAQHRYTNGAYNWLYIGSFSFQPSEVVKLALLLIVSYCLSVRKLIPAILFAAMCLGVLMLQKDLGTALLYAFTTLAMVYAATGSLPLVGAGLGAGALAAVYAYNKFDYIKARVAIWQNPWTDPMGKGYQIVQALIAVANGGIWGVGLGAGNANVIPENHNDFIFAVILNEFGLIFGILVLLMFIAIVIRGVGIAMRSRNMFHALLACGASALIALQTFVIIGGNIKLIPLTGVTLPFISYGGTSLVSSLCLVGFLQGVASRNDDMVKRDKELAELTEE